jgi:acetamidase/formamidase
MRTFQIMPTSPGQHVHHLWALVATTQDGSEVTVETYETMHEADKAKAALERSEMENRR